MIYILVMLIALGCFYVAGAAAYGHFKGDGKALTLARARLRIAEGGLRKIANGISGAPELDAQNTLDDVYNYNKKELE